MDIFYLHGLKSKLSREKRQVLEKYGTVFAPNIDYLLDNPNSILVIEDAEELIVSRDQKRNSNLAMILNMKKLFINLTFTIKLQ